MSSHILHYSSKQHAIHTMRPLLQCKWLIKTHNNIRCPNNNYVSNGPEDKKIIMKYERCQISQLQQLSRFSLIFRPKTPPSVNTNKFADPAVSHPRVQFPTKRNLFSQMTRSWGLGCKPIGQREPFFEHDGVWASTFAYGWRLSFVITIITASHGQLGYKRATFCGSRSASLLGSVSHARKHVA